MLVTPVIMKLARLIGCIDHPGKRSMHRTPTPLCGGFAFAIGIVPVFFFLEIDKQVLSFIVAASILVVLGFIDDYRNLGWKVKLLGTLVAISIIVFMGDVTISDLGLYGMNRRITLGILSIPFTYLCIVGVTNATNLIDGLNGLAGGIAMIAFFFLGLGGFMAGEATLAFICFAFTGALLGFLIYNFPKARIFMGDSGSLPLGFSLAVLAILLTQGNNHFNSLKPIFTEADLFLSSLSEDLILQPMYPVLVLILPIFDTLRVMSIRMFQRKNPFHADKIHLHHMFIRKGFSPVVTVMIFWVLSCLYGIIAVVLVRRSSTPYLVVVLVVCLFMSLFAESMSRRKRVKPKRKIGENQRMISKSKILLFFTWILVCGVLLAFGMDADTMEEHSQDFQAFISLSKSSNWASRK